MRIVVDLQAAQGCNAQRGIGGYSLAFVEALIAAAHEHDVVVVLNGAFGSAVDDVSEQLRVVHPSVAIEVWFPPRDLRAARTDDAWTRRAAEIIREEFLASLRPDVVVVASLFEGFVDAAVTSVGSACDIPTAVVLYDLIPLVRRADYLTDPAMEDWYESRLGHLRRADRLLAISGASRAEAIQWLDLAADSVIEIGTAVRPVFQPGDVDAIAARRLRDSFHLRDTFVLYTGGIDPRKNVEGLIDAYALLSPTTRERRQLVIVCEVHPDSRAALQQRWRGLGLADADIVLTGYVDDHDLLVLYRLCEVAVFPSLHEGFGLPALEAMACGRPVIASDRSSLPEVLGRDDALFDPTSPASIAAKLAQVLDDKAFSADLAQHGLERSSHFSWAATAQRALDVLEQLATSETGRISTAPRARPSLAFLSPLPPEQSGISDYSAILLPHLATHYDIDVISDLERISDPWLSANCTIRTNDWFRLNHHYYDRIVYNFGNSSFHGHMFDLLDVAPGVVVLHDFSLSGIIAHQDALGQSTRSWADQLYHSHGYPAVRELQGADDPSDIVWRYPANLRVLQQALGVIVHSQTARNLADEWYGPQSAGAWHVVGMPRSTVGAPQRATARMRLGVSAHDLLVCSFGIIGPTKLNDRLVDAWVSSDLAEDPHARLVFVGESNDPAFAPRLTETINAAGLHRAITVTGRVDADTYAAYLAAADIGVQLRKQSRGETSASAYDCLAFGLATIVNANGSLTELPADAVIRITDEFDDSELIDALHRLSGDRAERARLGETARQFVNHHNSPRIVAESMAAAIESVWRNPRNRRPHAVDAINRISVPAPDPIARAEVAHSLVRSTPTRPRAKHLFVDVSELTLRDSGSGIQRVTRNIVAELLENPPQGYRVEPVAATTSSPYRAARRFSCETLGINGPTACILDVVPEFVRGDIFLGLDLQPIVVQTHRDFFRELRRSGVEVSFVVYDLLPILTPESFYPGAAEMYGNWLTTVREADTLVAISRNVQRELAEWLARHPAKASDPRLNWFHLGSELDGDLMIESRPDEPAETGSLNFLMVGTIEPRKCHSQVLDAFEVLWQRDHDVHLTLAGRVGWMVDDFIERLRSHRELGSRLHWIEDASDHRLAGLYRSSAALLAASTAEGFGLPLIEAAKFNLPIIARDIPVFHEVAGDHATYFSDSGATGLAAAIETWNERRLRDVLPSSLLIPRLSWAESTEQLLHSVLGRDKKTLQASSSTQYLHHHVRFSGN